MNQKLIENAIVLFAKHGYDTVTKREIAFETGISEDEIEKLYPQKEELLDAVFQYIEENLDHYNPTKEDLLYLVQKETPENILRRFVTSYNLQEDYIRNSIYHLIFKNQYRSNEIGRFGHERVLQPPRRNAEKTLVILTDMGVLPPGESRAIAEVWNRTSLIYEMLSVLHDDIVTPEEYLSQTEFFIKLAVRGVKTIPMEKFSFDWKKRADKELKPEEMSRKQRIMFAALDLFEKEGYPNVSMGQIARAAGISGYSIYSKYPSKSAIMRDIIATLLNTNRSYEESPVLEAFRTGESGEQILLKVASAFAPIMREDVRRLYRVLFKEQYNNEDAKEYMVSIIFDSERKAEALLEQIVKEGRIPPLEADVKWIARAFVFSMCSFTVTSTFSCVDVEENERTRLKAMAFLISFVLNGFRDKEENGNQAVSLDCENTGCGD